MPRSFSVTRSRIAPLAVLLTGMLAAGAPAFAQEPDGGTPRDAAAEPYLHPSHWSRSALRRLAGLGLVDASAATMAWPAPRARVRALLESAAEAGEVDAGSARPTELARAYAARFREELGASPGQDRVGASGWVSGGWTADRGGMLAGASQWVEGHGWRYAGPTAAAADSEPLASAGAELSLPFGLAASAEAQAEGSALRAASALLSLSRGPFDAWAGRRDLTLGGSPDGALVLTGGTPFDGAGLSLAEGRRLPGPLRRLGPIRGTLLLARMERSGTYAHPWLAAARVDLAPAPSLSIGLNRASMFGGAGNEGVTPRRIALMALGFTDTKGKDSDFENQVASVDALWRTRLAGLPTLLYGEWGFDDVGHAWFNVPAVIVGVEVPSLPGLPALSVALEHVWIDGSCCGNPPWYRHGGLAEGWTDRGAPLGHPLGGHGRQTSLRAAAAAPGAGILAGGRLYARRRGDENLFAPDRAGGSVGAGAWLGGFVAPRVRVRAQADVERGEGWWAGAVRVGTELRF